MPRQGRATASRIKRGARSMREKRGGEAPLDGGRTGGRGHALDSGAQVFISAPTLSSLSRIALHLAAANWV